MAKVILINANSVANHGPAGIVVEFRDRMTMHLSKGETGSGDIIGITIIGGGEASFDCDGKPYYQPPKLSHIQQHSLAALVNPHSYQEEWGCTNRTMAALERLGLVEWEDRSSLGQWKITQAGRDVLAKQEGAR